MKRFVRLICVLLVLSSCGARQTTSKTQMTPEDLYGIPIEKDIDVSYKKPSSIDLRGIRDSITWIHTPDLSDCFGFDDDYPRSLSVVNDDKLISAKLIVDYYPTIWSDEDERVVQLIRIPSLSCKGTKELTVDYGRIVPLSYKDLYILPQEVKEHVARITQQDLLNVLETEGSEHEFENWATEKKIWKRYISKYHPGDFADNEKGNNRFGTYPNTFYLQLKFDGKKGAYLINLCDRVIIGN